MVYSNVRKYEEKEIKAESYIETQRGGGAWRRNSRRKALLGSGSGSEKLAEMAKYQFAALAA